MDHAPYDNKHARYRLAAILVGVCAATLAWFDAAATAQPATTNGPTPYLAPAPSRRPHDTSTHNAPTDDTSDESERVRHGSRQPDRPGTPATRPHQSRTQSRTHKSVPSAGPAPDQGPATIGGQTTTRGPAARVPAPQPVPAGEPRRASTAVSNPVRTPQSPARSTVAAAGRAASAGRAPVAGSRAAAAARAPAKGSQPRTGPTDATLAAGIATSASAPESGIWAVLHDPANGSRLFAAGLLALLFSIGGLVVVARRRTPAEPR